jgi:hypothetical protein
MKKVLLGVIISIGCIFNLNAQSKFSLGPNVGIGASWLDNTPNRKAKPALNAGVALVYSATERFGIGLDAKYSFEGGKYSFNNQNTTADLNYFRVPLKAIYFFGKYGNRVRPKVYVGPSFGFLAGGKTKIESSAAKIEVESKDYYESFDFGVTAGAGLNVRLARNTWFNGDLSYLHGISDVIKNSGMHNRNVAVSVGVNFGL